MSPYHFLRTFRQVAGMTPHQYVLRTRLHRAAVRLRRTDDAISAIAYDAGFNDLSTFNRRFRRVMGSSPGLYRAGHGCSRERTLDAARARPHTYPRQSAGRPPRLCPKGCRGGKSGLHGRTVPDNVRRGWPRASEAGLRESATENRPPRPRCVLAEVRVKRWGKSPPRSSAMTAARQTPPGAKPNRNDAGAQMP